MRRRNRLCRWLRGLPCLREELAPRLCVEVRKVELVVAPCGACMVGSLLEGPVGVVLGEVEAGHNPCHC